MTKHLKEADRLRKIIEAFPKITITVLADLVADEFGALKGEGRLTDAVVIFDELDVRALISEIRPDIQAKGTDHTVDSVPERDVVAEYGGRVAIVGDAKDHSTSEIIRSRMGRA